jgi:LacI family transcriptional regulator
MAVSLKQVAERAGVSGATVSRVLNGKELDRIPIETRERIMRIAQELDYRPNRFARILRDGRTGTVGLMVSGLTNPFFVEVLEAAERYLIEADYQVVQDAAPSVRGTYQHHGKLQDWPVDGVIMWAYADQTLGTFLGSRAQGVPVVYLGYDRNDGTDNVYFDYYEATYTLMRNVVDRGYRNLCFVCPHDYRGLPRDKMDGRGAAFFDVCEASGVEQSYYVIPDHQETRTAGREAGLAIGAMPAAERPRVLICHNDVLACGIYHGLRRSGLRIPEDIAITGFDGTEEGQCLDRPLTTVLTPAEELCRHACDILLRRMQGKPENQGEKVKVSARLLVGETT